MKKSKKFPNLKLKKYQTISKSIDEPLSPTIDPPNESKLGMNKEKNN